MISKFFTRTVLCLLCLTATRAAAQDSTYVKFLVKAGSSYFVRINGQLQPQQLYHRMARGANQVEIWAPKFNTYTTVFETGKTDTTSLLAVLKTAPEWASFLSQKQAYQQKIFAMRTLPFTLAVAGLVTAPFFAYAMSQRHETLVISELKYRYAAITLGTLDEHQRQHSRMRNAAIASTATATLGTAAFLLFRKQVSQLQKPVFRQQNPFTLDFIQITAQNEQLNISAGLSHRF